MPRPQHRAHGRMPNTAEEQPRVARAGILRSTLQMGTPTPRGHALPRSLSLPRSHVGHVHLEIADALPPCPSPWAITVLIMSLPMGTIVRPGLEGRGWTWELAAQVGRGRTRSDLQV